ncbi:MAG: hypothetical protein KME14_26585 [Tildeniella torsiva UHER 1998/13D]|jgi:hypothetical protein|nr:hypothetical protein [Tildeniella torsiva UHER 1998/13D]
MTDPLFSQYVNAAPSVVGDLMVAVVDTAKGLKHGAIDNNMAVSDEALFKAAVKIVLAARREARFEDDRQKLYRALRGQSDD